MGTDICMFGFEILNKLLLMYTEVLKNYGSNDFIFY